MEGTHRNIEASSRKGQLGDAGCSVYKMPCQDDFLMALAQPQPLSQNPDSDQQPSPPWHGPTLAKLQETDV